ncbi:Asp-tRNA(Asn)/Glu-tRNA(Gln) amidotransferase subunit GatC [bacterium]|nr:Asp-tRNA(Asn)/Glu-tRNA(Gln) amidotransferase subunit GatC [bacterium]|tara:strand:+ start:15509 stop:15790 length:282 start_codon:yes stop_codon:yes gene_type:complete
MIDKKEVIKISKLSRLSIEDKKVDSFIKNFSEIIQYINLLEEANVPKRNDNLKVEDYSVRDDSVIEKLEVEDVVKNSAKVENNFFAVKKVIDE